MKKIVFLGLFLRIIHEDLWNLFEKIGQLTTPTALADLPPGPAPHPLRRLRGLLQRGGQAAEAAGGGARHGILLLHLLLGQGEMLTSANEC